MELREPRPVRRLSRRKLLVAAGGLLTGAAVGPLACRGGEEDRPLAPSPTNTASGSGSPTSEATEVVPPGELATTLVYVGLVRGDGEFDPHRTQSGPLVSVQSLVYSRLLAYESQADGVIVPDLALALPEQPDEQTYVFRLRTDARWHDLPPVGGRPVTAEDVRFSLVRQIEDESFVRHHYWRVVERVEVPAPDQLVVKTSAPYAPLVERFADPSSFVVPPELAEAGFGPDRQVGSGPYAWVEWREEEFASVVRNPAWFGGPDLPRLAGITVHHPTDGRLIEADFRTKRLDVAFVSRREADRLKAALPALVESQVGQAFFFGMRFFTPARPYDDPRVRKALAIAVDRRALIDSLFEGSGDVNGWVSWPVRRWAIPPDELSTYPGYRLGSGGRDQDIAEARALLDAYRAEHSFPEEIGLLVFEDVEQVFRLGARIEEQVESSLGIQVRVYPLSASDLVERMFSGQAPWMAGPDAGWIDLDDWLYPFFHSAGAQNTFALRDEELDAQIERQRTQFDPEARRSLGLEIQRRLLELNPAVNFVSERAIALSWPYVRDFPLDILPGFEYRMARTWIDTEDPEFLAR